MEFLPTRIRLAAALVAASLLAGCVSEDVKPVAQTNSLATPLAGTEMLSDAAPHHSTCSSNVKVTRKNALVADRMNPGDTHYIEFRLRPSAAIPTGHMFIVYGKLDEAGNPASWHYTGLYPKGSVAGLYTGIIMPVALPADVNPSILDCTVMPSAAYRRSLSADQYQRLLAKVTQYKTNPPKWAMLSFNCNHYAASIGQAAGLVMPGGNRSTQFLSAQYFSLLVEANGDTIYGKAPAYETAQR